MAITANQVKELRERTGLGMMDCKKALVEADGDSEKAVELLRKKGLKTAEKRADRETSQGWLGLLVRDDRRAAALVDLACETDFVAKSDDFQGLLGRLARHVLEHGPESVEAMLEQRLEGEAETIAAVLQAAVGRIGEKIQLRHVARYEVGANGGLGAYLHHNGRVGVLVQAHVDGGPKNAEALRALLENVAMHVAALRPIVVRPEDLPAELVAKEREIYLEQVKDKPEKMRAGIVEGMIRKRLYAEKALLDQPYVRDDKLTVAKALQQEGKAIGGAVAIDAFSRFEVGEGS